jgi:molybdopterin molybdotransferase/putative molybdopterin biosynthesis protein
MAIPVDPEIDNQLKERRQAAGLTQQQLAAMAGITRQSVAAVETGQYSPATSVALRLARALDCRVEDLFSIKTDGEVLEGELLGILEKNGHPARAQVTQVSHRLLVRPLDGAGELRSLAASADGLIIDGHADLKRVRVKLLKDRDSITRQISIGGCDPAMFLAAEHLGRYKEDHLVPCVMGNGAALEALKRGEVHAAGVHLAGRDATDSIPKELRRSLGTLDCLVVTFAHWEEGIIVGQGNPKKISSVADLANPKIKIINREKGSGARRLLDGALRAAGLPSAPVKGYGDEVRSHLEAASRVRAGLADAGIGVRAAATIFGLEFISLQRERYDLLIPKMHYDTMPAVKQLLDLIVEKSFRAELEAFGGYDTRESGKIVALAA